VSLLILTTCFAQTTPVKLTNVETQPKLSQADFYNVEPVKVDFEEETYKSQTKKNNLSDRAKTALWVSLLAAGLITVVFLATRKNEEDKRNSPCSIGTSQVGVPCPPGCFCIQ